ncbi:MAG: hypothetical protein H0U42_07910 [Thermoleophilaceae bacterium]|nr:hypothetical protein [Thermoleophilaceae bacterium]
MSTPREERLANNEALFRLANERMAGWEERHVIDAVEAYLCECSNRDCREKVALHKAEYEAVRSGSLRFLIVSGHDIPDVETVVEEHGEWSVVAKPAELVEILEESDPRVD